MAGGAGVLTTSAAHTAALLVCPVRAASKSSCRHLSCVDATKEELRRGVNMVVLSGASNRRVTLTCPEGRC
jgi:hypothetical protein